LNGRREIEAQSLPAFGGFKVKRLVTTYRSITPGYRVVVLPVPQLSIVISALQQGMQFSAPQQGMLVSTPLDHHYNTDQHFHPVVERRRLSEVETSRDHPGPPPDPGTYLKLKVPGLSSR